MHVDFIVSTEPSGLPNKQPDPKYVQFFQQAKGKKTEKMFFYLLRTEPDFVSGKREESKTTAEPKIIR